MPTAARPEFRSHGEIQDTAVASNFAQVQFRRPESEPERASEVFDLRQMAAFQTVRESGIEPGRAQTRRDGQTDIAWCWIGYRHLVLHEGTVLIPNIDADSWTGFHGGRTSGSKYVVLETDEHDDLACEARSLSPIKLFLRGQA